MGRARRARCGRVRASARRDNTGRLVRLLGDAEALEILARQVDALARAVLAHVAEDVGQLQRNAERERRLERLATGGGGNAQLRGGLTRAPEAAASLQAAEAVRWGASARPEPSDGSGRLCGAMCSGRGRRRGRVHALLARLLERRVLRAAHDGQHHQPHRARDAVAVHVQLVEGVEAVLRGRRGGDGGRLRDGCGTVAERLCATVAGGPAGRAFRGGGRGRGRGQGGCASPGPSP